MYIYILMEEVELAHGQRVRGLAEQRRVVRGHEVGLRVHADARHGAVPHHVPLAHAARVSHRRHLLAQPVLRLDVVVLRGAGHEGEAVPAGGAGVARSEHRTQKHGLRSGNRRVRISYIINIDIYIM
jgi:hypothetical protein